MMLLGQWHDCRLSDLFENRKERGLSGSPILSVTMTDGLVDRSELNRKQDSTLLADEHLRVEVGDIAYNTMRMWQGAFGCAEKAGNISPAYVVLKPRPNVEPLYFSELFRSPRMLHQFWAYSYGLTDDRLRLYYQDFSAIRVRVPPLSVQRQIYKIISTWNRAVEVVGKLASNAESRASMLTDNFIANDEGVVVQLRDVIGELEAGVSVNGLDCAAAGDELGVLKTSSVTVGVFAPAQNKLIKSDEVGRARVSPKADRIIVSRINTLGLVGASAYIDQDYPRLFLPDRLWQLQPKSAKVYMKWLAVWLSAKSTRSKISSLATGSSGSMKNISKEQFLSLSLVLPPYARQQQIVEEIGYWSRIAKNLRQQASILTRERSALMQKILRDSTDMGASGSASAKQA